MNFTILRFDEIGSTNTEAINQAKRGAAEGLCIVARQQTSGRGRHGRIWISPKDAGLYFSIVLRPKIETQVLPLITLMSAIAVYETLKKIRLEPDIKWVNDIYVRDRKICGILSETIETPKGLAVVVGIGINLKSSNFSEELRASATSVEAETGAAPETENLLQILTGNLSECVDLFYGADGARAIREEWMRRSSYAFGKSVRVSLEGEMIYGVTRGLEDDGALRVELATGEIKIVHAGDVTQVRQETR